MVQHSRSVSADTAAEIELYATAAIVTLRANGVTNADILAKYCAAHPSADAEFEAVQRRNHGRVLAPAAAVTARMRELVNDAASSAVK